MNPSRDHHSADAQERSPIPPSLLDDARCELCGGPIEQADLSVEAFEATGFLVCADCIEDHL